MLSVRQARLQPDRYICPKCIISCRSLYRFCMQLPSQERKGYSNQNAVLFSDDNASVLHVFHSQQGADAGESAATVWHLQVWHVCLYPYVYGMYITGVPCAWQSPLDASDFATNFSKPRCAFDKPGSFDKNRLVPRLDGSWMLPLYEQVRACAYAVSVHVLLRACMPCVPCHMHALAPTCTCACPYA